MLLVFAKIVQQDCTTTKWHRTVSLTVRVALSGATLLHQVSPPPTAARYVQLVCFNNISYFAFFPRCFFVILRPHFCFIPLLPFPLCITLGRYNDELAKQDVNGCSLCPTGTYNDQTGRTSLSDCTDCPTGKYNDQSGRQSCKVCPNGQYNDQLKLTDVNNCKDCPLGRKGSGTNKVAVTDCTPCSLGTYTGVTGLTACTDCPRGRYNDENLLNANTCKECGSGKYTAGTTTTNPSNCLDCGLGKHNPVAAASGVCQDCPIGYFTSVAAQAECKLV